MTEWRREVPTSHGVCGICGGQMIEVCKGNVLRVYCEACERKEDMEESKGARTPEQILFAATEACDHRGKGPAQPCWSCCLEAMQLGVEQAMAKLDKAIEPFTPGIGSRYGDYLGLLAKVLEFSCKSRKAGKASKP